MCMVMAVMWWSVAVYRGVRGGGDGEGSHGKGGGGDRGGSNVERAAVMVAADKPIGRRW